MRQCSDDGDTALIGALGDDNGFLSGSAYVFVRSGSSWSQQAKLLAADGSARDFLGQAVSVSGNGDTALVGAYRDDENGDASGSAYVFARSGSSWSQEAKLVASEGVAGDQFGISLSLSDDGDTALIGASEDFDTGVSSGSAYVFERSNTSWFQSARLRARDGGAFDGFGRSVSLSDGADAALVGALLDTSGEDRTGSAYLNFRDPMCDGGELPALFECVGCPAGSFCPEGVTAAIPCSRCAVGKVVTAACTASADTMCGNADEDDSVVIVLVTVAVVAGVLKLVLVVRRVLRKRYRRAQPAPAAVEGAPVVDVHAAPEPGAPLQGELAGPEPGEVVAGVELAARGTTPSNVVPSAPGPDAAV